MEAFEAVLSSKGTTSTVSVCSELESNAVLPEALVVLQRLTERQLKEAGVDSPRVVESPAPAASPASADITITVTATTASTSTTATTATPTASAVGREEKTAAIEEKRGTFVLREISPNIQVLNSLWIRIISFVFQLITCKLF